MYLYYRRKMSFQEINIKKRNKILNKVKMTAAIGAGLYLLPQSFANEISDVDKVSNIDLLRYNEELTLISILMNGSFHIQRDDNGNLSSIAINERLWHLDKDSNGVLESISDGTTKKIIHRDDKGNFTGITTTRL